MGFLWAYYLLLKKWQRKRIHCFICVFAIFIIHDSWQICIPIYCIKWHKTYKKYTCKFNIIHPFPNIIKRHVWWKLCKMYTFTSIYVQRFSFKMYTFTSIYVQRFSFKMYTFTSIYVQRFSFKMYTFTSIYVQRFSFKSRFVQCPHCTLLHSNRFDNSKVMKNAFHIFRQSEFRPNLLKCAIWGPGERQNVPFKRTLKTCSLCVVLCWHDVFCSLKVKVLVFLYTSVVYLS
jgi:hypothetical protein